MFKENVIKNISRLTKNKSKIVGYGSPAKATTALNFFGISKEIECILEDNKLKQGKFIPGVNIPIVSKEKLNRKPEHLLAFAWNFFNFIKKNNKGLAKKFISLKELQQQYKSFP